MERLERQKTIERTKSMVVLALVLLVLAVPSFVVGMHGKQELLALGLTAAAAGLLYRRMRRLNQKLALLAAE